MMHTVDKPAPIQDARTLPAALGQAASHHIQQVGGAAFDPATITNEDVVLTPEQLPFGRSSEGLTADDKLELLELEARFNFAVDVRDLDQLLTLLHPDAVLDHQWGYREGVQAIIDLIRSKEPAEKGVRHQNLNPVIWSLGPDRARMLSYLQAVTVEGPAENFPAVPFIVAHAVQTVDAVKGPDGRWRIERLLLEQTLVHTGLLPRGPERAHDAATATVRARLDGRAGG